MYQPVEPANTGPPRPMQAGDILYFARVTLFITLLFMGYELSRPLSTRETQHNLLLPATAGSNSPGQDWTALPPWQRKASEKAVEKYAATQEKKWQRWNESMFERST